MSNNFAFILLYNQVYLVNPGVKEFSFPISEIIELGLKEKLKQLGENFDEENIKQESLKIEEEMKREQEWANENERIYHYLKTDLPHFNIQAQYGNKDLNHFSTYLTQILNKDIPYQQPLKELFMSIEPDYLISEPHNISVGNKSYSLQHIKQQHKTSCGLTCVAMLTEQPYDQVIKKAREISNWHKNSPKLNVPIEYLIQLLSYYGITDHEYVISSDWDICSDLAIAIIKYSENIVHAVIFFRKNNKPYVIDPALDTPLRVDFHNMSLQSFIKIN